MQWKSLVFKKIAQWDIPFTSRPSAKDMKGINFHVVSLPSEDALPLDGWMVGNTFLVSFVMHL